MKKLRKPTRLTRIKRRIAAYFYEDAFMDGWYGGIHYARCSQKGIDQWSHGYWDCPDIKALDGEQK